MKWNELYDIGNLPSMEGINAYLGAARPLWNELTAYIEEKYQAKAQMAYSKCSAQPGWNVKYKKGGKSLCTLYPMENYFIALLVVGAKEEEEVEMVLKMGSFTPYLKELYNKTAFSAGGRWLMIEVKDQAVLRDIKLIMGIRVRPR